MQESTTYLAQLDDRSVLRVSGGDVQEFLNGLVTGDIATLADGSCCHAGLLTPQGKILFEFLIHRTGDTYLIDVAGLVQADLAKRLGFYKLRADVDIALCEQAGVMAAWGAAPGGVSDPRLPELGARFVVEDAATAVFAAHFVPASLQDYEAHRIALGVPEGGKDYPLGDTFPHDACFDQLGGVSFTKGCYVGQEVVSRMRHRGTARKRIVYVDGTADLPPAGEDLKAGDRSVGVMGSAAGPSGLAMVRLDRVAKAISGGQPITCAGQEVTLRVPAWADYSLTVAEDVS